jgi:hypothetical protein
MSFSLFSRTELLAVTVLYDEIRFAFLDGPGRREAAIGE